MSIKLELRGEVHGVQKSVGGGYVALVTDDASSFTLTIGIGPLVEHVLMPYSRVTATVVIEEPFADEADIAEMMQEQEQARRRRDRERDKALSRGVVTSVQEAEAIEFPQEDDDAWVRSS